MNDPDNSKEVQTGEEKTIYTHQGISDNQQGCGKAGIEKDRRHPHVFRHGFAANAVLSCVPSMVLRRWMGHASIDTTLIYTEVLVQDTKGYLDKMKF